MEPKDYHAIYYRLRSGEELTVREARPEDAQLILDYINMVSGESNNLTFGAGQFDFSLDDETRYLEDIRKIENAIYLLGFINDQLVAALSFTCEGRERTKHVGEFGITVLKSHWGKGIGEALITTLIEWAHISGVIYKINLAVRSDNERAIALYKKLGFKIEGLRTRDMRIDGVFYDSLLMGLEIN